MKELFVLFLSRAKTLERMFFDVSIKVGGLCDSVLQISRIRFTFSSHVAFVEFEELLMF